MKFSLRTLLILPFLLQVIGITSLVGYLSYRSGQRAISTMSNRLLGETAARIIQNLETYFQIPPHLTKHHQTAIAMGLVDWQNMAAMEAYFVAQLRDNPNVSGLMMATADKAFLAVGRPEPDRLTIRQRNLATGALENYVADAAGQRLFLKDQLADYDPHNTPLHSPWYRLAQASPSGLWLPTVSLARGNDRPILMMAYFLPFTDRQGKPQGVLSTSVYLDHAGAFLRGLGLGEMGQAFIVDGQGHLVATSTEEFPFRQRQELGDTPSLNPQDWWLPVQESQNPVTRAAAQFALDQALGSSPQAEANAFTFKAEGTRYIGLVKPFILNNNLNWRVVLVIPQAEFTAASQANLDRTALLCALALLGTIGLGIWTAEYITRPIRSLQQATQAFTDGTAVVPPTQPTRIKEVEALRQGFDHMVGQLASSFRILRERENTLATFLNGVPVGVSVHDRTGQMLFLNDKGREYLVEDLAQTSLGGLLETHQIYVAGTDQLYPTNQFPVVRGLQGETAYTDDLEIDMGGQRIPFEVHTIPVFDPSGQVLYSINAFQDISERRQAEQLRANYERELEQRVAEQTASIAKSEATKQALINAIPDLLVRLDRQGIPLEIYNLEATHWLGHKADGHRAPLDENLPPSIALERRRCIEMALATGTVQRQEYEFSYEGKLYCEEARIVPVTQDEVLVVVRDISDRRKIDLLKDEFIAIVSHELRTPLTAIRGALGILESGVLHNRPEKAQHLLQMALANTERLIRLVNDILDLERLASGKVALVKEFCQVTELMQVAMDSVEALAMEAGVLLELTPLEATVWVAPGAIEQALTNLLTNAIKFSPSGSKVWLKAEEVRGRAVECGDTPSPSPYANGPVDRPPPRQYLLFSVIDQGRGIPADRLEAIFDRFQQVDVSDSRQKGGTGLGLAICKSIVEQHGGEIWVDSVLGQGSTFYFTLPIEPA